MTAGFSLTHSDGIAVVRFDPNSNIETIRAAIGASNEFDNVLELWDARSIVIADSAADIKELALL